MTTIKIDDKDYDVDEMSDNAKAQLISIQYCDQELQRLQLQVAAIQTARMAYGRALHEALEGETKTAPLSASDKLKFS